MALGQLSKIHLNLKKPQVFYVWLQIILWLAQIKCEHFHVVNKIPIKWIYTIRWMGKSILKHYEGANEIL